jgi:hypothetical protein
MPKQFSNVDFGIKQIFSVEFGIILLQPRVKEKKKNVADFGTLIGTCVPLRVNDQYESMTSI